MKKMQIGLLSLCSAMLFTGCAPRQTAALPEQKSTEATTAASTEKRPDTASETEPKDKTTAGKDSKEYGNQYSYPKFGIIVAVPEGWEEFNEEERAEYFPDDDYDAIFFNLETGIRVQVETRWRSLDLRMDDLTAGLEEAMKGMVEHVNPVYPAVLGGRNFKILDVQYDSGKKEDLKPGEDFYKNKRFAIAMSGEEILTISAAYTEEAEAVIDAVIDSMIQPFEETVDGCNAGYWEENTYLFDSAGMRIAVPEQMRLADEDELLRMGPGAQDYYCFVAVEDSNNPEDALRMRQIAVFALDDLGKPARTNLELVLPNIASDNDVVSDITTLTVSGFEFASVTAQKDLNGRLINKLYLLYASNGKLINIVYTYNTLSEQEILDSLPELIKSGG